MFSSCQHTLGDINVNPTIYTLLKWTILPELLFTQKHEGLFNALQFFQDTADFTTIYNL